MELEHTFTVPTTADEAFRILQDIERIAPCMPGATIESVDGDEFTGKVKVKVGPMQVTYRGTAKFVEIDEEHHRGVIEASGKEARGSGTAKATFTATLNERDGQTDVKVVSDLAITGRPAQFGRGVMADVGEKLIGTFADCLATELADEPKQAAEQPTTSDAEDKAAAEKPAAEGSPTITAASSTATAAPPPASTVSDQPAAERTRPTDDVIDLLDVAGGSVAKRFGPAIAAAGLLVLVVWLIRRRS